MNEGKSNHNDIHLSFGLLFGNVNKLHVTQIYVPGFLLIALGQHVPR